MRLVMVAVLASLVAGCAAERKEPTPKAPQPGTAEVKSAAVEELPSPTGDGAAEPFLFAAGDAVLLSWLEPVAGTDRVALRFARYAAGRWSAPRSVVERNDLFVNWADFPSIVEDVRGVLFAHWLQKSGGSTYAYDVRMATSADGGATWGKPFLLNRDGLPREHGFATLAALPGGGVGAVWLDGRKMKPGSEDEEDTGEMTIRYAAVDADGGLTREVELDGRTCECCTTGMTMTAGGPVVVYRDRSADDVRDIAYVTHTVKGWTAPRAVHADGWKIDGCPVNGPQADALGDRAVTAWFTAANGRQHIHAAFSGDSGLTFGKPIAVDDGKPVGRLDVTLLDGETALVTWLEQTAAGAEIRARRVRRDGVMEPAMKIADTSAARAAGFVRTARLGRDVFFTWTGQGAANKRVHVARVSF